jgi:aldehyde dehydrogenase (NAD+)
LHCRPLSRKAIVLGPNADSASFSNYVDGSWQPAEAGRTYTTSCPFRPDEVLGEFPDASPADVDRAVSAADAAYPAWAAASAVRRSELLGLAASELERRAEQVSLDMTREVGLPIRETRVQVGRGVQILRYYASAHWSAQGAVYRQTAGPAAVYHVRRPLGPVAILTPWNFPVATPLWKLGPALAAGNSVVLKVSELSPRSGIHLAECFDAAGLPAGVVNVVVGTGPGAGAALIGSPAIRAVSFTGSVEVGQQVRDRATEAGKRVQLELGGHNPLLVLPDADLGAAAEAAFAGAFWSAGQKCTSTRRIFVHSSVYEQFKALLLARIDEARVGDPLDSETELGPLVSERQLDRALHAIAQSRDEGATLLAGGQRLERDGFFLGPTLFEDVAPDGLLARDEVFAPVAALFAFDDLTDAIARANGVRYGLSAAIFTNSRAASNEFLRTMEAGVLKVNAPTAGIDLHVPFGGLKESGWGPPEQGADAIDFYTDTITVYDGA